MNKSCLPNPQGPLSKQHTSSCIESANNHVEEMVKQTTAKGAKDRKRGPYKSCLVSFSSYYLHCTSPTLSHVQLWAERQRELSARVLRRGSNHEKNVAITKFLSRKFSIMEFSAISRNFEPRKFGAIRVFSFHLTPVKLVPLLPFQGTRQNWQHCRPSPQVSHGCSHSSYDLAK